MTRVSDQLADLLDHRLAGADRELQVRYPGDPGSRQPVHTVYVPADRFTADEPAAWGRAALELLDREAPTAAELARATGLPEALVGEVHDRVRDKLATEPVEDLRVDLEDGYGRRPDDEEDRDVRAAAAALAELAGREGAPPFLGIRFKSFEAVTRRRGLRSLDLLLDGLLQAGGLPEGLQLTLPKVTSVAQVAAMVEVCQRLEETYGLPAGRLRFEIQVETPQAVLAADGTAAVAGMVGAAAGRCSGLHYGTYDYSAALGIAAAQQSLDHPAADHAKAVMQLAAAGTGVRLSDGSTNVLPVGERARVHAAWRLHAGLVERSLRRGFYQGWDMHPGHLPTRYLATYAFFRRDLPATAARLRAYLGRVAGDVLDEPATAQALAGAVLRGVDCGAVGADELAAATGADRRQLEVLARRAPA
jgi:citrate lyase beta subunit